MFVELIATIVAGIACAGIVMLVNRAFGRRLPKWLTPVAAGLGMIAMTISNEYTWFSRTAETLPEGVEIAVTVEESSWFRPWTQAFPYIKRFAAVDMANAKENAAAPGQRLVDLYFFGRWSPVNKAPMLFDCPGARAALLIDGADFAADGTIADADFQPTPPDDPILTLVCET